jgi:hypothetical protein
VHPDTTRRRAARRSRAGWSDHEVARRTGVSQATVCRWRRRGFPLLPTPAPTVWTPRERDYPYLLGLYLGDGCITEYAGGTLTLDIACDCSYPGVMEEAESAMSAVFQHAPVRRGAARDSNCIHLRLTSAALEHAFPQHGRGPKHLRAIELTGWQRVLTHRAPEAFLRGLIHSDGSRCINRFDTELANGRVAHYEYVRYFFTNYSADIRRLFCEHCELLRIRWTQSNSRNISISHRDSVAILERIVGPKT